MQTPELQQLRALEGTGVVPLTPREASRLETLGFDPLYTSNRVRSEIDSISGDTIQHYMARRCEICSVWIYFSVRSVSAITIVMPRFVMVFGARGVDVWVVDLDRNSTVIHAGAEVLFRYTAQGYFADQECFCSTCIS